MLFEKYGRCIDDFLLNIEDKLFIKRFRENYNYLLTGICCLYEQKIQVLEEQFLRQHQLIQSQRKQIEQIFSDYQALNELYQAAIQPKRKSRKKTSAG